MSDYIIWIDEYNLGHQGIDAQHRQIINIINGVYNLVMENDADHAIGIKYGSLLFELRQYTISHFSYEESIMREIAYPDIVSHSVLHKRMAERTAILCSARKLLIEDSPSDVLQLLKNWWLNHIRSTDKLYVPFLKITYSGTHL